MFFVPGFALGSFQSVELLQVSAGCPIWSGLINSNSNILSSSKWNSRLFRQIPKCEQGPTFGFCLLNS